MTVLLYILCVIQSTNDRDIYIYMYVYIPRKRDRQQSVEVWPYIAECNWYGM